jgi:hypothetical protein
MCANLKLGHDEDGPVAVVKHLICVVEKHPMSNDAPLLDTEMWPVKAAS